MAERQAHGTIPAIRQPLPRCFRTEAQYRRAWWPCELMRFVVLACLATSAFGADLNIPSKDLYEGWLKMYDLKFDDAHQVFREWKQSHPADALGPASDAAAYLFSELARLGILESELFVDDTKFEKRAKPIPDPQ